MDAPSSPYFTPTLAKQPLSCRSLSHSSATDSRCSTASWHPKSMPKTSKTIGVVSNHPAFKSFSKRSCSRLSAPLCWGPLKGSTSCLRCCRSWLITVTSDFPRIAFQIFYLCWGSVFRGKLFRGVVFQSTHAMMSCLRHPENLTLLRMHLQLVPGQHEVVSPARFMMIGILFMAQVIGATINPQHGSKWTNVAGHQPFCRLNNPRKPLSIPQIAILCSQISQPVSVPEWMFLSPVIPEDPEVWCWMVASIPDPIVSRISDHPAKSSALFTSLLPGRSEMEPTSVIAEYWKDIDIGSCFYCLGIHNSHMGMEWYGSTLVPQESQRGYRLVTAPACWLCADRAASKLRHATPLSTWHGWPPRDPKAI